MQGPAFLLCGCSTTLVHLTYVKAEISESAQQALSSTDLEFILLYPHNNMKYIQQEPANMQKIMAVAMAGLMADIVQRGHSET